MKLKWLLGSLIAIFLAVACHSQSFAQTAPIVSVDFSQPTAQGSPLIFGGTATPQWQPIQQLGWDKLQEVGVTFIRQDISLESFVPDSTVANYQNNVGNIQSTSTWNQGGLDYIANKFLDAQKRGMKTMVIIDYAPAWLTYNGLQTGVPKDWGVWEDIVKKSIQYMNAKGVHFDYYEVWNEPGDQYQDQFFDVSGSGMTKPEAYVQLYSHTWDAIKSVDPSAKVGGPADYQIDSAKTNITYMLQSTLINHKIDFVSYHYYDQLHQYLITGAQFANLPAGSNSSQAIKQVLTSLGRPEIPIILSEYNYTCCSKPGSGGTKESVLFIAQNFIGLLKAGVLAANYFTTSSDFCTTAAQYLCFYQIINNQAVLQPEGYIWRLASKQLGLGKGASQIFQTLEPPGVNAVGATNSDGQPVVLLANSSGITQTVSVQLNHLTGTSYLANVYQANLSNDPTTPTQTANITATAGTASVAVTIPAWSAAGVSLTGAQNPPSPSTSPQSTSTACTADINQDGTVNLLDYSILVANFFKSPLSNVRADLNQDGQVNLLDYSLLVGAFLQPCANSTSFNIQPSPTVSPIPTPSPIIPSPSPTPVSAAISNLVLISTTDGSQAQVLTSPVDLTVAQLTSQTIKALTSAAVKSVQWTYTSNYNATPTIATDSGAPFTLVCDGNNLGWYCPWDVGVGDYQVTANAFDQLQAQGTKLGTYSLTVHVK